jgi:mRNA-degrading endonuclease toxin of MazEF toxin-antitoxin module
MSLSSSGRAEAGNELSRIGGEGSHRLVHSSAQSGATPAAQIMASCVPFHAGQFGFTADCVAQCENILSIDKRQLDRAGAGRIGMLDEMAWREVVKAIGNVVGSDCEPT